MNSYNQQIISDIRSTSQQITNPEFNNPKDLVAWMGAIQAQDYNMAKWAIGIRLKSSSLKNVEKALQTGEILRTHIMRPTWHFVPAEDIRWMLKLSVRNVKNALRSYSKYLEIPDDLYTKCNKELEKLLRDNNHLTKEEIANNLINSGIIKTDRVVSCIMTCAEAEGIVCSGIDKTKKVTFALIDERAPHAKELHKDDALAKLAQRYFRSHSPASLLDFSWWSGLTITESRHAIHLIASELIDEKFKSEKLYVQESYNKKIKTDDKLYFLPSYDEYLISYKDRTSVLDLEHQPKAFSMNGIFHPVILYKGKIIGNWKKTLQKKQIVVETSFFKSDFEMDETKIQNAENQYKTFIMC